MTKPETGFDRAVTLASLLFGVLTLGTFLRMVQCVHLSITDVPVRDQWFMLDELIRFHEGKIGLSYLWSPYWGHRIVIPRLFFLLDERFAHLSNTPLVLINVASQCFVCGILILLAHRALKDQSFSLQWLAALTIAHLCFSSLQMENFVYGMAIQYTLGCSSALAAIVLLAHAGKSYRGITLSVIAGLLSALTSAAGLVLWPVLIVEAILLRASLKTVAVLTGMFFVIAAAYMIGFNNVGEGMGAGGFIRHPLSGLWIASMVLGGPLSVFKPILGQLAGLFGIAATLLLLIGLWRQAASATKARVVLVSTSFLFVGVAIGIVVGRMSREFVASFHDVAPVSSRYFTFSFLFWAALLPSILSTVSFQWVSYFMRAGTVLVVGGLTLGTITWQLQESLDWVSFTRQLDAAASSFFVIADDPQRTAIIFPNQAAIDSWIPYLKQRQLSVFHAAQAAWIGKSVTDLIPFRRPDICRASLSAPAGNGRVTGTIPGSLVAKYGGTNIVFTGADERIIGMGRTTFDSHRPFPPAAYPFLGYLRNPEHEAVTAWSLGNTICRF